MLWTGQGRARHGGVRPGRTGLAKRHGWVGYGMAVRGKAGKRHGQAGQGRARRGKAGKRHGKAGQGTARQNRAGEKTGSVGVRRGAVGYVRAGEKTWLGGAGHGKAEQGWQ